MISGSMRASRKLAILVLATTAPAALAQQSGEGTGTKDDGFTIKVQGRLQIDLATYDAPSGVDANEGWEIDARRARLGVVGELPGDFDYQVDVEFGGDTVEVVDAFVRYKSGGSAITLGQVNNFQSLEELTSDLHMTMLERAAFTRAFGFERRLGISATRERGDLLLQSGVFTDNLLNLSDNSVGFDGRVVYAPELGSGRLHTGASAHYFDRRSGSTVEYRQRPFINQADIRPLDTGEIPVDGEWALGVEAAWISGPFHAVSEAYWQKVDRPSVGSDPQFFGAYVETGIFITPGDTRGYGGGRFERVKPANPVNEGGIGSVQLSLRYDYLDLDDRDIMGGKQNAYIASVVWKPIANAQLLGTYGHLQYDNAALPTDSGSREYAADVFALRAQFDF